MAQKTNEENLKENALHRLASPMYNMLAAYALVKQGKFSHIAEDVKTLSSHSMENGDIAYLEMIAPRLYQDERFQQESLQNLQEALSYLTIDQAIQLIGFTNPPKGNFKGKTVGKLNEEVQNYVYTAYFEKIKDTAIEQAIMWRKSIKNRDLEGRLCITPSNSNQRLAA